MSTTPILFADLELVLTAKIRAALALYGHAGTFVSNRREAQSTAVQVRRDGGPTLDQVREAARVGVNVWAPTEQAATNLANVVSAIVRACADGNPIIRATQTLGPSPIADETGLSHRYMTFEIWQRGTELTEEP